MANTDALLVKTCSELFNSGFIFADDFRNGKRFARYCSKCRDSFRDYLNTLHDTDADVSNHVLAFFMFWASDKGNDAAGLPVDKTRVCDWRRNLIQLAWCEPFDFQGSDIAVKAGWVMYFENPDIFRRDIFEPCLEDACFQYLHGAVIDGYVGKDFVTSDTFCMNAVPEKPNELMRFHRILINIIWCYVYSITVWGYQDRADDVLKNHGLERENQRLLDENQELKSAFEKILSETLPGLRGKLRDVEESVSDGIRKGVEDYRTKADSEIRALKHKNKDLQKSVDSLREDNKSLRERIEIFEQAACDDDSAHAPGSGIDYDSRILFIACRAENGGTQGTYDRLLRRFPNSRMVHDPKDIQDGYDCYVMLTKYLFTHASYWAARDRLSAMGAPYVHSGSQNVDMIASEIFGKSRYK